MRSHPIVPALYCRQDVFFFLVLLQQNTHVSQQCFCVSKFILLKTDYVLQPLYQNCDRSVSHTHTHTHKLCQCSIASGQQILRAATSWTATKCWHTLLLGLQQNADIANTAGSYVLDCNKMLTYVCTLAVVKHQVMLLQTSVKHEGITYPCTLAAVKHVLIHYFNANYFHISICGC